ncbi:MAG: hypothetical protein IPL23_25670 [Saprospiraceae bacterium]|nr:hypothetical protein [Saprospiraceae bacterium]
MDTGLNSVDAWVATHNFEAHILCGFGLVKLIGVKTKWKLSNNQVERPYCFLTTTPTILQVVRSTMAKKCGFTWD